MQSSCYLCDELATTKEHVPPRSFFPKRHKTNLMTVPSCALHNNSNSMDVEYVRNLVTTTAYNDAGRNQFLGKTLRSYRHSQALFTSILATLEPAPTGSKFAATLTVDMERFNSVLSAMASAIHYRDTDLKIKSWAVLPLSLLHSEQITWVQKHPWFQLQALVNSMPLESKETANPSVFQYKCAVNIPSKLGPSSHYRFLFYETFHIHVFSPVP